MVEPGLELVWEPAIEGAFEVIDKALFEAILSIKHETAST
jgi:hypothetical protein